jgi:hypothetical protein
MNATLLLPLIAGTLFTLSAQAHDCSGGIEGGMDATGNQCNGGAVVASDNSSGPATSPLARAPKAEANKAPSANKSVAKRTTVTRQTSARSQTKQS